MGLTTTASSARFYRAFCATVAVSETVQSNIFTTHIIPDEEDAFFSTKGPCQATVVRRRGTGKGPAKGR